MTELDTTGPAGADAAAPEPAEPAAATPRPTVAGDNAGRVDEGGEAPSRRGVLPMPQWWVVVVAVVGLLLVAAAAIDLTVDDAGSQITILVVAGVLLLVLPLVLDRLTSVNLGASGLRFELTNEIAAQGAVETARLVDSSAPDLAVAAETYGRIHARGVGREDDTERRMRIRLQDELVAEASISARLHKYDAAEVRRLFRNGSPVVRVLVLGLMRGDQSLASVDTLRSAIRDSRTGNEQYQGLVLANRLRHRLSDRARSELTEIIRDEAAIWHGTDRKVEARKFVGDAIANEATRRFRDRVT